jgi:tRNA(Ile)-lysidine synthase
LPDFAALLTAALGHRLTAGTRIAVAVSGGPDSLALLNLVAHAFPDQSAALTVDHGLRAASAAEAATVAALCGTLGIPHAILPWCGSKPGANIQAAARTARYALMGAWCAAHGVSLLLTAHHADDQAETLLMQLQRGSGVAGLAGIRTARPLVPGVTLVRPLLKLRRTDLAAIVKNAGWVPVDDPSNADPRYGRTRIRALLAANPGFDVAHMALAAAHLAEAEAALDWAAARAWDGGATAVHGDIHLDITGLPPELVRRLVVRAITTIAPTARVDGDAIVALVARLTAGATATVANVKASGGATWHFSAAPARRKIR